MSQKHTTYKEAFASFQKHFGEEIAAELMSDFVEAVNTILQDLEAKIAQRDALLVKPLTHRLIGLCPIYEAASLAELSAGIETEMAVQNWPAVDEHQAELQSAFRKYLSTR